MNIYCDIYQVFLALVTLKGYNLYKNCSTMGLIFGSGSGVCSPRFESPLIDNVHAQATHTYVGGRVKYLLI